MSHGTRNSLLSLAQWSIWWFFVRADTWLHPYSFAGCGVELQGRISPTVAKSRWNCPRRHGEATSEATCLRVVLGRLASTIGLAYRRRTLASVRHPAAGITTYLQMQLSNYIHLIFRAKQKREHRGIDRDKLNQHKGKY